MDFGPLLLAVMVIIGIAMWLAVRRKSAQNYKSTRRSSHTYASLSTQQFHQHWQRIEDMMNVPGLEQTKAAIFEADKLLDTALRQSGFRGETMGERLKNARQHFGNNAVYQGLWEAHKMRNALAHEVGFDVPKMVGKQHLEQFKAGLHYLRVL